MKKVVILSILVFISVLGLGIYVEAAGGGGGSSSSGSGSNNVIDRRNGFSEVTCSDDGRIKFYMSNIERNIIAYDNITNESITVSGKWDGNNYESDKRIFTENKDYYILNEAGVQQDFTCPGLNSCFLIKFENVYCRSDDGKIVAGFDFVGDVNKEDLKLNFKEKRRTLVYTEDVVSSGLESLEIDKLDNSFEIKLSNNNVETFEVIHQSCIGKEYLYAQASCGDSERIQKIDTEKLKCGGLLELRDRVRCRINLETEKDEYENFYPEECRNHKNPGKCLQIYRDVSTCWDILSYKERSECLKSRINLGDLRKEKENCGIECRKNLNEKLITMIKLRFYNLEEQAEILEENGLLDEELLISFVAEIENKKLEFNEAKNKMEMRSIINSVRELWKNLMRSLRNG